MSEKKTNRILYISILSVFAFGNCMGAVDGALSKIACALNVDHTIALYVGSIPALTSMISGLILGVTAGKKLPYKAAAVFCAVLMIAAGMIPVIMQNFAMLLIARCFFGLGLGGIMSLQNPIAARLIPLQNRAAILGLGTCTAFTFQCILQLVGGILADIHWNLVFLTHMILIIPLVGLLFLLPEMQTESFQEKREERKRLPLTAVMMCVVIGIVTLNLAPLLFGSAFYVAAISDSATIAAIIAMLFSIGCMAGGLLYPRLYKILKEKCFTAFLIIGAAGLIISASATSIPILALGFFIGGISFSSMQAALMMLLGLICCQEHIGFASALMMIFVNLGGFLCSGWETVIGVITGDSLYMPLFIGAAVFVILAVILLVKSPLPKEGAKAQTI